MRKWTIAALAAGTALRLGVIDLIKEAGKAIWDAGRSLLTWHRERMAFRSFASGGSGGRRRSPDPDPGAEPGAGERVADGAPHLAGYLDARSVWRALRGG